MFANLHRLISRRPPPDYDRAFVETVRVTSPTLRHRRIERLILLAWLVIAAKCWLVLWAVEKYHVPVNPLWVIAPTIAFALLCTAVYFWRD